MSATPAPIEVFYSYADADEPLCIELDKHLSLLVHEGLITAFHKRQVTAGMDRMKVLDQHLSTASIILLLISPDFMASDYCYGIEMYRAMERHEAGEARVIPVLLRSYDIQNAPFVKLQALPSDGRPITEWLNHDKAFANIAQGIRAALELSAGTSRQTQMALTASPSLLSKPFSLLEPLQRKWPHLAVLLVGILLVGFALSILSQGTGKIGLVDVQFADAYGGNALDIKVRNTGEISFLKLVKFNVQKIWELSNNCVGGGIPSSYTYDMILPVREQVPYSAQLAISQEEKPNTVDRFTITLGNESKYDISVFVFLMTITIFYNEDNRSVTSGNLLFLSTGLSENKVKECTSGISKNKSIIDNIKEIEATKSKKLQGLLSSEGPPLY